MTFPNLELTMKRFDDPTWVSSQAISLDFNYAMADFVVERGRKSWRP